MKKRIEDIAKELKLSTATISRALNRQTEDSVKLETRRKILEFVKSAGYRPDIKARSLATGRSATITLLIPLVGESVFYDEYYFSLIKGVSAGILGTEYTLNLLPLKTNYTEEEIYSILLNYEIESLILSPYSKKMDFPMDIITKQPIPIVSIDNEITGKNIYNILLDQKGAGYKGAEYLWKKGFRNFVLISDAQHSPHSDMRKEGFYDYFKNKSNEAKITHIEFPFTYVSGLPALENILKTCTLPVSVFSLNDEIAVEMINAMKDKGVECPKDISILGFDGVMIGNYTRPRLSSVKFPVQEAGKLAAEILITSLMKKRADKKHIIKAFVREGKST